MPDSSICRQHDLRFNLIRIGVRTQRDFCTRDRQCNDRRRLQVGPGNHQRARGPQLQAGHRQTRNRRCRQLTWQRIGQHGRRSIGASLFIKQLRHLFRCQGLRKERKFVEQSRSKFDRWRTGANQEWDIIQETRQIDIQ